MSLSRRQVLSRWASGLAALPVLAALAPGRAPAADPAPGPAPASPAPASKEPPKIPLWNGPAPGAKGTGPDDTPQLTCYLAAGEGGPKPAMLVLPGGGYGGLAAHEGAGYADWFSRNGISAFVLNYRLGSHGYRHPVMLQDAARGLRTIRAKAAELNVDPARIGVVGSSAGGHLASTLLTKWDAGNAADADPVERVSSRPDVGILCYPVVTMSGPATHGGSRDNLLGPDAPEELRREVSAELHVTPETPPTFLWHTAKDPVVPVANSLLFASALDAKGVPFALHVYERGPHGLGLKQTSWGPEALRWLSLRWPVRIEA